MKKLATVLFLSGMMFFSCKKNNPEPTPNNTPDTLYYFVFSNQTQFTHVKCLDLTDNSFSIISNNAFIPYVNIIVPKLGHTYKFWCYSEKNLTDTTLGMTGSYPIKNNLIVKFNEGSSLLYTNGSKYLYNHTSTAYWNGNTLVAKDSFLYTYH